MVEKLKFRVVFLLLILGLAAGILIYPILEGNPPFNLGLDLRGGVTLRYALPDLEDQSDAAAKESVATVIEIFNNRLDSTGVKDVSVRGAGKAQIEVAIPGISSDEADDYKSVLQSVGRL